MSQAILDQLDDLADSGYEILLLEPRTDYDKCLVGVGQRFHDVFAVYDEQCIIDSIKEGIDDEDAEAMAQEHFEFNILGGWVGDSTPAFITKPV